MNGSREIITERLQACVADNGEHVGHGGHVGHAGQAGHGGSTVGKGELITNNTEEWDGAGGVELEEGGWFRRRKGQLVRLRRE